MPELKFCAKFCPYDKDFYICPLGYERNEKLVETQDVIAKVDPEKIKVKSTKPKIFYKNSGGSGTTELKGRYAKISGSLSTGNIDLENGMSITFFGQMTDLSYGIFTITQTITMPGEEEGTTIEETITGSGFISATIGESDVSGIMKYTLGGVSYSGMFELNYNKGKYEGELKIDNSNIVYEMTMNFF